MSAAKLSGAEHANRASRSADARPIPSHRLAELSCRFGFMGDPVGYRLVASHSRPAGNVTGVSSDVALDIGSKRLEAVADVAAALPPDLVRFVRACTRWFRMYLNLPSQ